MNRYSVDAKIAEIYDQTQHQTEDVELISKLIGLGSCKILEPFCGTGRIFIPLIKAGHEVLAIDNSPHMLAAAQQHVHALPHKFHNRIRLFNMNVMDAVWPSDFDVVILGNNALNELGTAEKQQACIMKAKDALRCDGYLYLDNYCSELPPSTENCGVIHHNVFPTGECSDGTRIESTLKIVQVDPEKRQIVTTYCAKITRPDGITSDYIEWKCEAHIPYSEEFLIWLGKAGFAVEGMWMDRKQTPYNKQASRIVIWAKRK